MLKTFSAPNLADLLQDPDLMASLQDPEVMAAFQDVSQNPANIKNYENNPKIKRVIEKLSSKFGKGEGSDEQPSTPSSGAGVPDMDID